RPAAWISESRKPLRCRTRRQFDPGDLLATAEERSEERELVLSRRSPIDGARDRRHERVANPSAARIQVINLTEPEPARGRRSRLPPELSRQTRRVALSNPGS